MAGPPPPGLLLALSPLLNPLRFVRRVGLSAAGKLKGLEELVGSAVARARAAGEPERGLDALQAAVKGFDEAAETAKAAQVLQLARALAQLLPLPEDLQPLIHLSPAALEAPFRTAVRDETTDPGPLRTPPPRREKPAPPAAQASADPLATPVTALKGVGPSVAEKLAAKGLRTVGDLLLNLPKRYEDRRRPKAIAEVKLDETALIVGTIVSSREQRGFKGRRRLEAQLRDEAGDELSLVWFHYRGHQLDKLRPGARVLVSGEVKRGFRGAARAMHHPDVEALSESAGQRELGEEALAARGDDSFGRVVPIYTEVEGVPARTYRRLAQRALEGYAQFARDLLPATLRERRKLLTLEQALREAHFPEASADEAALGRPAEPHRRLAFEEFFAVQLALALKRRGMKIEPGIAFTASQETFTAAIARLPWALTGAQARALQQIAADMRRPEPMNRLLQGDVGSGKTAVALVASLLAVADGYQAAIMAPTELLAEQHFHSIRAMLKGGGEHVELLVGSLPQRERAHTERLVRGGGAKIVVGTHALAEENTAFHRLGLAVIDEQHRFGVMTRAALMGKGARPDVLVMTATPIPRTLALTLYGDLDSSVLDELPPGRTPITTKVYRDSQRERAYEVIRKELDAGHQAYVVLPLVEESEKLLEVKAATTERDRLAAEVFPGVAMGLVHGRQSTAERTAAMDRFRRGIDKILVATTVIEVGVDVPNASVMLIEHAERFGLSQLHQLRGRVGRGAARSFCLLVTGTTGIEWSKVARERLGVMEETQDGFRIAEADLALRGPGEFLGTRQSGMPDFAVAELARDQDILQEAREEAFALVEKDPAMQQPENRLLREELLARWRGRLSLARVG